MTKESFLSVFMGKNIIKILVLLICIYVSIPNYYHLFDNGSQIIQLEKLASGEQSFNSRNVTVTGRLLADKAVLETESQKGNEKYRRYIIPFVKPNYNPQKDAVYCFIEREFKQWDYEQNENDKVQQLLSLGKDSIVTIKGVAMNFLHESLISGLSKQSASYFKREYDLNVGDSPLLIQLEHKLSFAGLIFMTLFQLVFIVLILISYIKIRKAFAAEDTA